MSQDLVSATLFLDVAAKALLMMLITWAGAVCLRRRSAATQHRWWTLGFVGCLTLPFVALIAPAWNLPIPAASPRAGASTSEYRSPGRRDGTERGTRALSPIAEGGRPLTPSQTRRPQRPLIDQPPTQVVEQTLGAATDAAPPQVAAQARRIERGSFRSTWLPAVVVLWFVGVLACATRNISQHFRLVRMLDRCRSLTGEEWNNLIVRSSRELGLRQNVALLATDAARSPLTAGHWRAKVVLPGDAENWPADRRRLALLHELAHVKRRDVPAQTLASFVCTLYWFHPLCWYGLLQMRKLRETACDDLVLNSGQHPADYADLLLQVARGYAHERSWAAV
ncbi:MAG: M56 family metallopeptidase, partial [Planctomycetota bacterium]